MQFTLILCLLFQIASAQTTTDVRQSLISGQDLEVLADTLLTIPREDRARRLIEWIQFDFKVPTEIIHFGDIHFSFLLGDDSNHSSLRTQIFFLKWQHTVPEWPVFIEASAEDLSGEESDRLELKRQLLDGGMWPLERADLYDNFNSLFANIADDAVGELPIPTQTALYRLGAPKVQYLLSTIPKLYAAGIPLPNSSANSEKNAILFELLREAAALLKIERYVNTHNESFQRIVLHYGVGHQFERNFSGIPNLQITTELSPATQLAREKALWLEAQMIRIEERAKNVEAIPATPAQSCEPFLLS